MLAQKMTFFPPKETKKTHLEVVSDKKSSVRCQVHGEAIVRDCSLSDCVFFTEYQKVRNCILVYMAKQDMDSLKPIDIGMLKGIPTKQVSRDLSRATQLMRNDTLRVSRQVEVEPKFSTIPNIESCCNCETPINYRTRKSAIETKVPRTEQTIYYCSSKCYEEKPPQHVAAEIKCQSDIKTIVSWAVKKYSTLGGLEQALGMNRSMLGETLKNLLGVEADELYPTTQRVKTRSKALVRRTGSRPEWLVNFQDVLQPLVDDMQSKYGEPKVDYSELLAEVQGAIENI